MSVLLVLLSACSDPPAPPQSTPARQDGPVQVSLGATGPVTDPVSPERILSVYPEISGLDELSGLAVVGVMNLVPGPCAPCDASLATCALAPPPGCENLPALVSRAVRVAQEGGDPDAIREAVSYPDDWVPDPTRAETDAVDVEVWIDASSPSTPETLARMSAITAGEVPIALHLRVYWDEEADDERPAALALLAAEEQAAGQAWLAAGGEAPGVIPDPGIFHARRGEASLDARLRAEQAVARSKGVRSTPTWFVEGYRLRGLQGEQTIAHLIRLSAKDLPITTPKPAPETP
jgi:hypothetical protein